MIAGIVLAVAIAGAGGLFSRRALQLYRIIRLGQPLRRFDDVPQRVRNEIVIVAAQRKLFQRLVPGLTHAFIFWGFVVLLPTILMALIGIVSKTSTIPWLGHQGWFALMADVFATMVFLGVLAAFAIRKIQQPSRFDGSHLREADLILLAIAGIVVTLVGWHASRIALGLNEHDAAWEAMWAHSLPWAILAHGNLAVFLVSAWAILVLYWSTSVRLTTAAAAPGDGDGSTDHTHHGGCFTCGLHICLDNH